MVVYATLAFWGGYHEDPFAAVALILVAAALYLGSVTVSRGLDGRMVVGSAIAFALIYRALLFFEPPFLSDDYFRYLWDGFVQTKGINPFRYAPADSALAGLDDALRGRVNHPDVPTIYPPFTQLLFLLVAALNGGWLGLKAAWLACDALIAVLIFKLSPERRRFQSWLIYAWSPLVIIEVAWNAHLDLLGVLPLIAAIWLGGRVARPLAAGFALALSANVKYFAAALLPAEARKAPLQAIGAFLVLTLALYLPYLGAGSRLFTGLGTFVERWTFNAGAFELLLIAVRSPTAAKAAAAAVILAIVAWSARARWPLERTAFWVTGSIIMLSPTVHPWYLLWMVPLIALRPSRAWLYLTSSVFLAYYGLGIYRAEGYWPEPLWLKLAIWGPFYLMLLQERHEPAATTTKPHKKRERNGIDG